MPGPVSHSYDGPPDEVPLSPRWAFPHLSKQEYEALISLGCIPALEREDVIIPRPYYVMGEDGELIRVNDLIEWARWFDTADRRIAESWISDPMTGEPVRVSTVFLVWDPHYREHEGPPLLFETRVVRGEHDGKTAHYATIEEAREGHDAMAETVRKGMLPS